MPTKDPVSRSDISGLVRELQRAIHGHSRHDDENMVHNCVCSYEAAEIVQGPLSEVWVLVQIPAVRKLVETMIYSEDQLISDRGLPSDEPDAYVEQWREALDATDG